MQSKVRDPPSAGWCPPTLMPGLMSIEVATDDGVSPSEGLLRFGRLTHEGGRRARRYRTLAPWAADDHRQPVCECARYVALEREPAF